MNTSETTNVIYAGMFLFMVKAAYQFIKEEELAHNQALFFKQALEGMRVSA